MQGMRIFSFSSNIFNYCNVSYIKICCLQVFRQFGWVLYVFLWYRGDHFLSTYISALIISASAEIFLSEGFNTTEKIIKALKMMVWHLSRKPMKEISSYKKYTISNVANKCGQTRQRTNNLWDELIWGMNSASELATVYYYTLRSIGVVASLLRQVTKFGVLLRQLNDIAVLDIFNEKRKSCNHWCPDSVYFRTLYLIIYLSAIRRLICHREMSLIGSTSFDFAQNTMHHFQNTVLNS